MTTNARTLNQRQLATRFPTNGVTFPGVAGGTAYESVIYMDDRSVASGSNSGWGGGSAVIASLYYVPNAAVTGVNTNNFAAQVRRYSSAGALVGTVASLQFVAGTNATAFAPVSLGTLSNATLNPGDILTFQIVQNGTGMAAPAGMVFVDLTRP